MMPGVQFWEAAVFVEATSRGTLMYPPTLPYVGAMRCPMSEPKTDKSEDKRAKKEEGEAARERELRDLIERVELEKSGQIRPAKESAQDFVERKMREKLKK
jgi:hypothetical protein